MQMTLEVISHTCIYTETRNDKPERPQLLQKALQHWYDRYLLLQYVCDSAPEPGSRSTVMLTRGVHLHGLHHSKVALQQDKQLRNIRLWSSFPAGLPFG